MWPPFYYVVQSAAMNSLGATERERKSISLFFEPFQSPFLQLGFNQQGVTFFYLHGFSVEGYIP